MPKLSAYKLCLLLLLSVGISRVAAEPDSAEQSFPLVFRTDAVLDNGLTVVNVSSWEKFKRIKRGEASVTHDESDVDEPGIEESGETASSNSAGSESQRSAPAPKAAAPPKTNPSPYAGGAKPRSVPLARLPKLGPAPAKPDPALITAPTEPTETGNWWAFYLGKMDVDSNPFYDSNGIDFQWAYSRKNPLPENPRIVVYMHGSGGTFGAMGVFGPSAAGDIEVRVQDAEGYNAFWRQCWTFGKDGQPYPGRRIAAALRFVTDRYGIDVSDRGIVLVGNSMGGSGAVIQTMNLPDPWREKIAYSSGVVGIIMPRQVAQRAPGQYSSIAPDSGSTKKYWDDTDFAIQSAINPIVRGIHYRHTFSSDDPFSEGMTGNTQLEFVNLIEQHKIGGAFVWVKAGHGLPEHGVNLPDTSSFESEDQDVTLDRAHPAITRSTGNYPFLATDRINGIKHPRGHYNMGIIWNHAGIVDDSSQIIFPLQYKPHKGIGKGVPDQPKQVTVSVTPRRPRNFVLEDGEILKWSWDNGALTGLATVSGDTVTIDSVPLVAGQPYKKLRIYR